MKKSTLSSSCFKKQELATKLVSKKGRCLRLHEAGQGGVFKLIHPECFRKCAVSVCVVSVKKAAASCKGKAELNKYFYVLTDPILM